MHAGSSAKSHHARRIGVLLAPNSLASRVLPALYGLGYAISGAEAEAADPISSDARVWLVDADVGASSRTPSRRQTCRSCSSRPRVCPKSKTYAFARGRAAPVDSATSTP